MLTKGESKIFDALLRLQKKQSIDEDNQSENGILTFNPIESKTATLELFSNLKYGGRATFVFTGRNRVSPDNYYFEEIRDAAKSGLQIERLYLLPHYLYVKDQQLMQLWEKDTQAGIKTKMIYVGDLLPVMELSRSVGLDFGIWDDQILCRNTLNCESQNSEMYEWVVSKRLEDLKFASNIYDELVSKGVPLRFPPEIGNRLDLDEPMVKTAPLMNTLAGAVCNGSYLDEEDCSWYHGIWQYLRIFDMVSTPTWHPDLYIPALQKLAGEVTDAKVLISGTADYSTLAHVLWAFDSKGKEVKTTIVDLCQTPLILCQWYARHHNHKITAVQGDIMTFADEPFDAIVTDAFLTRFDSDERPKIIRKWWELLKDGGRVITTARIRPEGIAGNGIRGSEEQAYNFATRARELAEKWKDFIDLSPEQIFDSARVYARKMVSHPYANVDIIRKDFENNHFDFTYTINNTKGELVPTEYAEIIATKKRN